MVLVSESVSVLESDDAPNMTKYGALGCNIVQLDELLHLALEATNAQTRYDARENPVMVEVVDSIHRLYVVSDIKIVNKKMVLEIVPEF